MTVLCFSIEWEASTTRYLFSNTRKKNVTVIYWPNPLEAYCILWRMANPKSIPYCQILHLQYFSKIQQTSPCIFWQDRAYWTGSLFDDESLNNVCKFNNSVFPEYGGWRVCWPLLMNASSNRLFLTLVHYYT